MRTSLLALAAVGLVACAGEPRTFVLAPHDGSAVKATAHLQEVTGKNGRVITARLEVADPAGRDLVGALVEGRCARPGKLVDTIQIASATGHLRGGSPTTLAALAGTHAIGLFLAAGFTDTAPGAPIACHDL